MSDDGATSWDVNNDHKDELWAIVQRGGESAGHEVALLVNRIGQNASLRLYVFLLNMAAGVFNLMRPIDAKHRLDDEQLAGLQTMVSQICGGRSSQISAARCMTWDFVLNGTEDYDEIGRRWVRLWDREGEIECANMLMLAQMVTHNAVFHYHAPTAKLLLRAVVLRSMHMSARKAVAEHNWCDADLPAAAAVVAEGDDRVVRIAQDNLAFLEGIDLEGTAHGTKDDRPSRGDRGESGNIDH